MDIMLGSRILEIEMIFLMISTVFYFVFLLLNPEWSRFKWINKRKNLRF